MAIVPAPLPDSTNSSFQSFPCRLPLNNPVPTTRFPPVVGESEKIECAVPISSILLRVRLPEVYQRRLLRMNGQIEAIKPLRKNFHNFPGIFFPFTTDDEIIGKTNQETPALEPWFYFLFIPLVQHMMQEDVTYHRLRAGRRGFSRIIL